MATMVGTQEDTGALVNALIELAYDVVAAYEAAAERMRERAHATPLSRFRENYEQQIIALKPHAAKHSDHVAFGPDLKELLTRGWVVAANWVSDRAILMALLSLEDDTHTALLRALARPKLDLAAKRALQQFFTTQATHQAWLEKAVHPDLFVQEQVPGITKHVSVEGLKETLRESIRHK